MYVLRREDQSNPFAVVSDIVSDEKVKKAIKEELAAESVEIHNWEQHLEWGESRDLKCSVIDEDGDTYKWEIEITKVVSYI